VELCQQRAHEIVAVLLEWTCLATDGSQVFSCLRVMNVNANVIISVCYDQDRNSEDLLKLDSGLCRSLTE
jgi:hypothetical protein